jgi:multidrug efflux pump subunit AcrA (membrane-fusion protein)
MTIAWVVENGTIVKAGDVLVRFDPTDFQKKLLDGRADVETAEIKKAKSEVESGSAGTNLSIDAKTALQEREYVQRYEFKDDRIFSRFEIADSQIDTELSKSRERYAKDMIGIKGTVARTQIDLHAIEARKADAEVVRAQKALAAVEIRAPHDGVAVLQRDWDGKVPRAGQTVWPGMKLAEIPKGKKLEAEIFVLEADAGGLTTGQRALVFPLRADGLTLKATVARVDTLAKPRFPEVPVQYFGATLKLEGAVPETLVPGQRVQAEVVLQEISKAIVLPRQAVFQSGGKSIVFRKSAMRGFSKVAVVLGAGAPGRVVVKEGLKAGDVVALSDPTRANTKEEAPKAGGPAVGGTP